MDSVVLDIVRKCMHVNTQAVFTSWLRHDISKDSRGVLPIGDN